MGCCSSSSADISGASSAKHTSGQLPSPGCDVPADWPSNGDLLFTNLKNRYPDAKDALLVQALSMEAYHAGHAEGRLKILQQPEAPAYGSAGSAGRQVKYRSLRSIALIDDSVPSWSVLKHKTKKDLADCGLDITIKAEERCGRPATAARVHLAPARALDGDYDIDGMKVLGEGINGAVICAKCRNTDVLVAVKRLEVQPLDLSEVEDCAWEANLFMAMDHPRVVRLVDVYISQYRVDLVMELMAGGDLFDRWRKFGTFQEPAAALATTQILEALTYLHSNKIAHRDMKLENCLYQSSLDDSLKLADFGFSQCFKDNVEFQPMAGTPGYMSPEVLQGKYTESCDMWALGVIVVILLTGDMPFPRLDHFENAAVQWDKSRADLKSFSKEALTFVESLLVLDGPQRLSSSLALQHPWILSHGRSRDTTVVDFSIISSLRAYKDASHFRQACWSVMAWALNHEERNSVKQAFLALDVSGTGTVHLSEMQEVLKERGVSEQEVEEMFRALDQEHNDQVGYSDFLAAMCAKKIPLVQRHVKEVFRRFDYENSGRVTERSLQRLFQTPMDDVLVNNYFSEVVGTEGLHVSQFEAVLQRGCAPVKSASVQTKPLAGELAASPTSVHEIGHL